jgi:hypothetical protein
MARQMGTAALVVTGLWLGSLFVPGFSSARAETGACAAWPGEPSPLPRLDHPDPFLARWAQLRAQELAKVAVELEPTDPRGAEKTWEHFRCLDPAGELARPEHEPGRLRTTKVADTPPVSSSPGVRGPDWSPVDAMIEAAEALVQGARFRQALETANRIRPTLSSIADAPGASLRRTQLEVLSATAQIALGRHQAAHESFVRALAADPELELDAGSTSPKIRRVFESVRGESGSSLR